METEVDKKGSKVFSLELSEMKEKVKKSFSSFPASSRISGLLNILFS